MLHRVKSWICISNVNKILINERKGIFESGILMALVFLIISFYHLHLMHTPFMMHACLLECNLWTILSGFCMFLPWYVHGFSVGTPVYYHIPNTCPITSKLCIARGWESELFHIFWDWLLTSLGCTLHLTQSQAVLTPIHLMWPHRNWKRARKYNYFQTVKLWLT